MDRNELYYRLLTLLPDGGFIFWPHNPENPLDDKGCTECLHFDNWVIGVYDTSVNLPTPEEIRTVSQSAIDETIKADREAARDMLYKDNIGVRAAFQLAKNQNPTLSFKEYVQQLEQESYEQ